MQSLGSMEIGVLFWAGDDPAAAVREQKSLGVRCGQMLVPGDMPLAGAAPRWKAALQAENFSLQTVFCAYIGEDYADIPTVEQTVGFIPAAGSSATGGTTRFRSRQTTIGAWREAMSYPRSSTAHIWRKRAAKTWKSGAAANRCVNSCSRKTSRA